jgi:ATP-binding cassette subfamily A (ABC1) protein 3
VNNDIGIEMSEDNLTKLEDQPVNMYFESVSNDLLRQTAEGKSVSVQGLRKVYKTTGDDRIAVAGLDAEMYEGQVTVLLGHNGAGKSTTINMLVGLTPPTSGDAMIRGKRITTSMHEIRQCLGVCPQHDILFPELTVMQHLLIFAAFKGVKENTKTAAEKMIAEVGLMEKAHVKAAALSGGQKRKLSLAIALIGDSSVVILDGKY